MSDFPGSLGPVGEVLYLAAGTGVPVHSSPLSPADHEVSGYRLSGKTECLVFTIIKAKTLGFVVRQTLIHILAIFFFFG